MPKGIVKWFNNAKGFGFILSDENSEDIFAHYSAIEMDGFRTLKAGQPVQFEIQQGQKGLHAANIRSLESSAQRPAQPTTNRAAEPSIEKSEAKTAIAEEPEHV
ncbi:MAG TPA: cold shock domain-containing protein CspD [Marinagarivorans sp.]